MKTLFPYQADGARWLADPLADGQRGKLLGDTPGLGKTIQAIRAADECLAHTILVVCPAIARPHWEREIKAESLFPRTVKRVETRDDAAAPADVLIVSWSLLTDRKVWALLRRRSWDVLILDEAHAAKNPTALRTIALYGPDGAGKGGLVERAARVWPLTGTPILNGPHEIWPHYRALFPLATKRILSYAEWMQETCILAPTGYGVKVLGARPDRVARLKEALSPFILRRRKQDVLQDMPPLRVHETPLPVARAEAQQIGAEVQKLGLEDATIAAAVADGLDVEGFNIASLSSLQRMLGEVKARPAAVLIAEELEGGAEKVVVFAKHRSVVTGLSDALAGYGAVHVDGTTLPAGRQAAIDRFQTDPAVRVFVGQIDACSTAITLTAASDVFLVEAAWVPAINAQAIQRVHRIGQTRPVVARVLYAEGTVDELVSRALARKAATLEALGLEDA